MLSVAVPVAIALSLIVYKAAAISSPENDSVSDFLFKTTFQRFAPDAFVTVKRSFPSTVRVSSALAFV